MQAVEVENVLHVAVVKRACRLEEFGDRHERTLSQEHHSPFTDFVPELQSSVR